MGNLAEAKEFQSLTGGGQILCQRVFKPEKVTVQHRETELIETHRRTYRHR